MEITLDRNVYPNSNTKEIVFKFKSVVNNVPCNTTITVCKLRNCYSFSYLRTPDKSSGLGMAAVIASLGNRAASGISNSLYEISQLQENDLKIDEDIVSDPKHLSEEDKQLLKIIHSEVDNKTWNIYYVLKDLIDNRIDENEALDQIKEILGD